MVSGTLQSPNPSDGHGTIPEWLLDAPLFIDDQLIKSLYNAVALPEFEEGSRSVSVNDVKVSKWTVGGQLEVSAGEGLLAKIIAGISGKATVKGDRGSDSSHAEGEIVVLNPVRTPERQLLNLAIHYAANLSERVWSARGLGEGGWQDPAFARESPKALIFLDIVEGTPFVPMAAEQPDGKVILFYDKIASAVKGPGQVLPPDFPSEDGTKMNEYWNWFQQDSLRRVETSVLLMHVIEDVIGSGGRARWIDYRVPLGEVGNQTRSLHLHFKSREVYDTGDFAYHLVRSGRKHGLRVVGTLKSGGAMNVLAAYER